MAITTHFSESDKQLTIAVDGRFDFSCHQDFRKAYEESGQDVARYVVDLKDATYLDSSALGMLLLLRDFAGGDDARVTIANCSSDVRKILTISNFQRLFTIQ